MAAEIASLALRDVRPVSYRTPNAIHRLSWLLCLKAAMIRKVVRLLGLTILIPVWAFTSTLTSHIFATQFIRV
ncbi:hypothetical protein DNTS_026378 [Danionella cerebrum]|uniref:Uncharacterized protein n=1 Tax=Danionella cerebrum TaxID=2873325 RepID=A0A553N475_9TELE|nr:hypothetical protein DNTS_026378 [Danionella translucida]